MISQENLGMLLTEQEPPCLSMYLPTHRRRPENQQDPIRYKNLLKQLETSVLKQYTADEAATMLDPFQALAGDTDFWNHAWDGLGVFGAAGLFQVIKLQRTVPELAVAANSFHIKPLLRILQSADRYQVLSLNRKQIQLFEGNRDHLDEVALDERVPRTVTEALGDELTEPHQTVASYGGTALGSSMRHGHGSKKDEVEIDEERFFRAVDRGIMEHHSKPSGLPLILAALTQYHTPFRKVSHNSLLLDNGIEGDPGSLTVDQMRERAWTIVEPEFRSRLKKLIEAFGEGRSKGLGSDDLRQVAIAASQSRVASLLVEAERRIPGHLDKETGGVTLGSVEDEQVDDVLDDLAEMVLSRGGHVVVVPAGDMPTSAGVAAVFRL
jgi:predicted Zn-dependent protease with MMP-like domain